MQTVRVVLSRARAAARNHPNCPGLTPDPNRIYAEAVDIGLANPVAVNLDKGIYDI